MKSLEESVIISMDGTDKYIFPYLPYILQDFWEIGASPTDMIRLIEKHCTDYENLKILDLGCGKGAVSIKIAERFGCECFGFDAIKEFIEEAGEKASEYNVESLCNFEQADIREKINELPVFDVIILGAIGPIFGDYYQTLTSLKKCLKPDGLILIDDAYIEDSSSFVHPTLLKRSELLKQISDAGMKIIEELLVNDAEKIKEEHGQEFDNIVLRCNELIHTYPEQKSLFEDYIRNQNEEYDVLDNKIIGITMAIKFR